MHYLATLAVAFAMSLGAVIVIASLFRLDGKRPNYRNIVAIPVGITIAEALRMAWPMSNVVFLFVPGASGGVAQFIGARRSV